jgi:hypothetical protein
MLDFKKIMASASVVDPNTSTDRTVRSFKHLVKVSSPTDPLPKPRKTFGRLARQTSVLEAVVLPHKEVTYHVRRDIIQQALSNLKLD